MKWLVLIPIIIFIAHKYPNIRKPLATIALVLVACITYILYEKHAEESASKTRIKINDIELSDIKLVVQNETGAYKMTGKIKNKSEKYNLSEIKLRATMCETCQGQKNEIIGEGIADITCDIPPMQSRYIEENIIFSGLDNVKGTHSLVSKYYILELKGTEWFK